MMIKAFFAIAITLGLCLSAHAQTQGCLGKLTPIKDTFLQTAVINFQKKYSNFSPRTKEDLFPCDNMKFVIRAFNDTLRRDYLSNHIQSYETTTLLWKDRFFSIERFVFKNKKAMQRMESALKQRRDNFLSVKSVMRYGYFVFENNIVFLVAVVSGCEEDVWFSTWKEYTPLFKEIEQNFMAATTAAP